MTGEPEHPKPTGSWPSLPPTEPSESDAFEPQTAAGPVSTAPGWQGTGAAEPTEPAETIEPAEPTQPTDLPDEVESTQPTDPPDEVGSTQPTAPIAAPVPGEPIEQLPSTEQMEFTAPTSPAGPLSPRTPAEPPAPAALAVPEEPIRPLEPVPSASDPRPRSALTIAAVVAVVLAVASSAVLAVQVQRAAQYNGLGSARQAALAAARTETAATLSYDYRHLDADVTSAERGLSNRFRAQYAHTVATEVQPLAEKNHAVTSATIPAAGVISATRSRAVVLVYADQVVQNNLLKASSRLDRSEIRVYMVKQGGRWLIDNLKPF